MRFGTGYMAGIGMALCLLLWTTQGVMAKPLVADMSQHVIEIDTRFTGTELLIFGVRNAPGDVVVIVRGPEKHYTLRKKERVAGMWVNRASVAMEGVADFFYSASTQPLETIADAALRKQLGLDTMTQGRIEEVRGHADVKAFVQAFIDERTATGVYGHVEGIDFMGDSLFKAVVPFSDRITRGVYTVEVYLLYQGRLQASQTTPLVVRKRGLDARIYDYAHRHPLAYGLLAVALALGLGWGMSSLLQRR